MRKTQPLLILAASLLLAAELKTEDAVKKDRGKLIGSWEVVSLEIDGQKLPSKIKKTVRAVFTATMLQTELGGKNETPSSYRVDPST